MIATEIEIEDVARLVAVNSVSGNESRLASHVFDRLGANGDLEVERVGDNVIARTLGRHSSRLLVAGHLDTVPGDPSSAVLDGDVLRGLGACDMKGSLAGMLHLATKAKRWAHEVTWVFYAREEIARTESGLLEVAQLRPDLLVADAAVLAEPTGGCVEAGCQGSLRVQISLHGRRAHTARPFTGRNAVHRLGELVSRIANYEPREVELDGVVFTEQLQVVSVRGGVAPNVVPDLASCVLNHRVAPDRTLDDALTWLRHFVSEFLEVDDELAVLDWAPSATPDLTDDHLARLVRITRAAPRAKVGWTDVATFRELGIASTNFGAGDPLLAHRSDEMVSIADVRHFVRVLEEWLDSDVGVA